MKKVAIFHFKVGVFVSFSPLRVNTKSGLIAFLIDASGERNGPENDAVI
jgi:hypothetical protein